MCLLQVTAPLPSPVSPCAASSCPSLSAASASPTLTSILSTLAPLLPALPNAPQVGQVHRVEEQGTRTASPSVSIGTIGNSSLQQTQGQVIVDNKDVRICISHAHPCVTQLSPANPVISPAFLMPSPCVRPFQAMLLLK